MRLIDLQHMGVPRTIGVWQVEDVLVDCGPASCVDRLLSELGDWVPRALLLTHIHLDHAGAAGALAQRFPKLEIYLHERGSRHLADPARLNDSVRRIYGDATDALWGTVEPIPPARMRQLSGGEHVGAFTVMYTPGHASHHVSFLHESGCAFVGDVAGVRIAGDQPVVPHAPPPDIDLEAWEKSLEMIRNWQPSALALPHFGVVEEAAPHIDEMLARLHCNARLAQKVPREEFVTQVDGRIASLGDELRDAYMLTAAASHSYDGFTRYWTKRAEAGGAEPS